MSQKLKTYSNKRKLIDRSLKNIGIKKNTLPIPIAKKCGEIYLEKDRFYFQCLFCGSKTYEDNPCNFLEHFEVHDKDLFLHFTTTEQPIISINLTDTHQINETVVPALDFIKTEINIPTNYKDVRKLGSEVSAANIDVDVNLAIDNYCTSQSKQEFLASDWNELIDLNNQLIDSTNENKNGNDSDNDNDSDNNDNGIITNINNIRSQYSVRNLIKTKFGRFQCPIQNCDATLTSLSSVHRHLKNQHADKPHKCLTCSKSFSSKLNLQRHAKYHATKIDKDRKPYSRESKLKLDLEKPNDDGLFHCKDCAGKYKSAYSRYVHSKKKHTSEGEIPHFCDKCGKLLSSRNNLREHMKIHTGERPFKCSHCDKSFANKARCEIHTRIHTGDKRYQCNYCGKSFITSTATKMHERVVHTKEKPLQCHQCGDKFFTAQKLKEHFRRHTGERPYPCEICNKSFFTRAQLKDHLPSHSNEKPFECNICGAKFPRKKALTTHKQLHADIKQYACKFCPQTFAQCAGLHSHMKQH